VIFQTSDAWGQHPAGSVVWAPLSELEAGQITPRALFTPTDRQAVEGVSTTKDRVVVTYIDNVRGRARVFAPTGNGWSATAVPVPDNMTVDVASTSDRSDTVYLSTSGFTTTLSKARVTRTEAESPGDSPVTTASCTVPLPVASRGRQAKRSPTPERLSRKHAAGLATGSRIAPGGRFRGHQGQEKRLFRRL
jgi:hypothetical protein